MRRILIPILMLSAFSYGQKHKVSYFSASLKTDVKNAFVGSKPTNNNPALDLMAGIHAVGGNFEINVGDELFNQIGYNRFFINFGYHSERYIPEEIIPFVDRDINFSIIPSIGFAQIVRYGKEDHEIKTPTQTYFIYGHSSHIAVQGSLSFRGKLTDKILIEFLTELSTRPDTNYLYPTDPQKTFVLSNFIGLHYVFSEN
jgi:hypothetical protein